MACSRHLIGTTEINADMKSIEAYVARQFLVMSSHLRDARPNIDLSAPRETRWLRYVPTYPSEHYKVDRHSFRIEFMSTPTSDDDLCSITDEMGWYLQPFDIHHINIEVYISIMLHKTEPRSPQPYMSMRWTGHLIHYEVIMSRHRELGATFIH
jgi:hypothetical protein